MTLPNDNIPEQIVPKILMLVQTHLQYHLFENVPEGDPTRAGLVKIGLMQENPADIVVSVALTSGDYEDDKYIDGHVDHPDLQDFTIKNLPRGEVGGGSYWWRRFSIRVQVFFVRAGYDEDTAIQHAYDFHGRLQRHISTCQIGPIEDAYGERALGRPYLESTTFFPSGGKNKFIFRGKLKFRVLTWLP